MLQHYIYSLKVIVVCGLFSCFGYFISQVLEEFYGSFTNFKTSIESPQYLDSPTFVLCMEPGKKSSLLKKYNVSHEDFIKQFKSPKFRHIEAHFLSSLARFLGT